MVGGKENVSKTTTADDARNGRLRRRLMLRDEAEPAARSAFLELNAPVTDSLRSICSRSVTH